MNKKPAHSRKALSEPQTGVKPCRACALKVSKKPTIILFLQRCEAYLSTWRDKLSRRKGRIRRILAEFIERRFVREVRRMVWALRCECLKLPFPAPGATIEYAKAVVKALAASGQAHPVPAHA